MLPAQVAHLKFRSLVPSRMSNRPPTLGREVAGSYVSGCSTFTTEPAFYNIIVISGGMAGSKYNFLGRKETKLHPANLFNGDGASQGRGRRGGSLHFP